jgi:hypothetical protein
MYEYFDYLEAHNSWLLCCDALRLLAEAGHPVDNVLNGLHAMRQQLIRSKFYAKFLLSCLRDISLMEHCRPSPNHAIEYHSRPNSRNRCRRNIINNTSIWALPATATEFKSSYNSGTVCVGLPNSCRD